MENDAKYRYRIRENFSQELLDQIRDIDMDPQNINNNMKCDKILFAVKHLGFTEVGRGTNRLCVRGDTYVYKIALDSYGLRDNWNEFNMSPELQPYVAKCYECNGVVAVEQYANLITKEEFIASRDNIRSILSVLSENYIFSDMGVISKNFCNWAYDDDERLVCIDYGYIYPIDRKIMFCKKCGSPIRWNTDFSVLTCVRCGHRHNPIEIRDRMWKAENEFIRPEDDPLTKYLDKNGVLQISIGGF